MIGVYGATGFIGRNLMRHLVSGGRRPLGASHVFDTAFIDEFSSQAELVAMDIQDPLSVAAALEGVETVIQLISTSSPALQNHNMEADIQNNVIPHIQFIRNAISAGVKRYVFISSGGTVYGKGHRAPITEATPTNPLSSHGLTKLVIEKYLQMFGVVNDLDFTILRLSNPYGPGQTFKKGQGLIPAILMRHANGQPITVYAEGKAARDFIFIDDVVEAIIKAIDVEGAGKSILNIGTGQARTVLSVIEALEDIMGVTFDKIFAGTRSTDVDISTLDITKAKQVLNWQPVTEFAEGLHRTVEAFASSRTISG